MSWSNYSPDDFRIEVSGWGLDNNFFAERTDLHWTIDGLKHMQLHRELREGTMVFIRLLASEPNIGSVPVAYRVQGIMPMDCNGRCQMRLERMRPRSRESKESPARKNASNGTEDSRKACDVHEIESELQREEILQ